MEERQGYLLKKSSKSVLISSWNRRYFVLSKGMLMIYQSEQAFKKIDGAGRKPKPKKVIDMSGVTSVNFHYDKDAPRKSKRLFEMSNKLDQSRFDIYTPTRTYMLRSESVQESVEWVAAL